MEPLLLYTGYHVRTRKVSKNSQKMDDSNNMDRLSRFRKFRFELNQIKNINMFIELLNIFGSQFIEKYTFLYINKKIFVC